MKIETMRKIDRCLGLILVELGRLWFSLTHFFRHRQKQQFERILFIKFWGIGSIIQISPALKAVRQRFPSARIDFLTLSQNSGIYEKNPLLDNIYYLNVENLHSVIINVLKLLGKTWLVHYDLTINFEAYAKFSTIFTLFSGTRHILGYYEEGLNGQNCYGIDVHFDNKKHISKTYLDLVRAIGVDGHEEELTNIYLCKQENKFLKTFLRGYQIKEEEKIVGININAGELSYARRWSRERFAKLADKIIDSGRARVVFIGSPSEKPYVEQTVALMKNTPIVTAGKTTLRELVSLIRRFDVLVTNDSGPFHIAQAVQTRSVSLFGPESPEVYGPLNTTRNTVFYNKLPCSPCLTFKNLKKTDCKHLSCLAAISAEEVYQAVEKYL